MRRVDAASVPEAPVPEADGLSKAVLFEAPETPNFAMRRFTLAPEGRVPRHTNEVEHLQYVLRGQYTVGAATDTGDTTEQVTSGDAMFIPAGQPHWYENPATTAAQFLCLVPNGDNTITLHE